MLRLLLGNIEPGTTDEELGAFLTKYGFPKWDGIEHVPGDGSRPAVILAFGEISAKALEKLSQRIHHMFWKGRELNAMIIGQYMP
ncbi:MAG TPA: RNA-binding protein [Dyella sp.]|uniref:RNA recognition motif domain-containing protein n=1 Tax=Dyella sp. TaxID=1869338 RepID=UPI002D7926B3|nr:RNA-binding protein [Dyella sp.]HET6552985.1 RNA-binding protein [Dyella sp.]